MKQTAAVKSAAQDQPSSRGNSKIKGQSLNKNLQYPQQESNQNDRKIWLDYLEQLQWLVDQLYECMNQLQGHGYQISSPQQQNGSSLQDLQDVEQYLTKYMSKVNREILKADKLIGIVEIQISESQKQRDSSKSKQNFSNRQISNDNKSQIGKQIKNISQIENQQEHLKQINPMKIQNQNLSSHGALKDNKHKSSIQTLSNRKNSINNGQKENLKIIHNHQNRFSKSSLDSIQTSQFNTLSPQSYRITQETEQPDMSVINQGLLHQNQRPSQQEYMQSIQNNQRKANHQLSINQNLENFQTNHKTRNNDLNNTPNSVQQIQSRTNQIERGKYQAQSARQKSMQSHQEILISPIMNQMISIEATSRKSINSKDNQKQSINKVSQFSQSNKNQFDHNTLNNQELEEQNQNQYRDLEPNNNREEIQNLKRVGKPKYHELPLQVASPSNFRCNHSQDPYILQTIQPEVKLQKQIEMYHKDLYILNEQVNLERIQYEQRERVLQSIYGQTDRQNITRRKSNKSKSKSKKRNETDRIITNDSVQRNQDKYQIDQQQQIEEMELGQFQNELQNQRELQLQREQKLKSKLKHQKNKFLTKVQEYKLYIESLKQKNDRLIEQFEAQKNVLNNIQDNKLQPQFQIGQFYESCMKALNQNFDNSVSEQIIQEKIIHEISILVESDIFHQQQVSDHRNEIDKLLNNQDSLSQKIRQLELFINQKQPGINCENCNSVKQFNSARFQYNTEISRKTLDLTERFDKLKSEIKKVQEQKRNLETQSPMRVNPQNDGDFTKSPVIENRLRQLDEREKQLFERENKIKAIEKQSLNTMRQSVHMMEQYSQDRIRQSLVEQERLEIEAASDFHQNTIRNLKDKLDSLQVKVENHNTQGDTHLKTDIDEIKAQLKELNDNQKFKSMQQMSPVQIKKPHQRFRSGNSNHLLTSQQSIEEQLKTKSFKLGQKNGIMVDSSSNFDSLHDVCNHQIDELKKTLRILCQEKDEILQLLDQERDMNQNLVNEKMELEILYSTKLNEIAYLHRYLDDSESEIRLLKQALEDQFNQMKNQITKLEDKLEKAKAKNRGLQDRIEMKDLQQHQMLMMSSKENSSIYMADRLMGTPKIPHSQNQSVLNDNVSASRQERQRQDSSLGQSYQNTIKKQIFSSQQMNRNQNSQSYQNLQSNTAIRNNQANSTENNSPSRNQSQPRPVRTLTIDVPLDDFQQIVKPERINIQNLSEVNNNEVQIWHQQSLLEQADNHQHFNPQGIQIQDQARDVFQVSGEQNQNLANTMNFNQNMQQSAKFLINSNKTQALEVYQLDDYSQSLDERELDEDKLKFIQYEEIQFQSHRSGNNPSSSNQNKQIKVDSITNSNYYDQASNSNLITPTSYMMMQYNQQQQLRNLHPLSLHSTIDKNEDQNDSIDISNTFKPHPQTTISARNNNQRSFKESIVDDSSIRASNINNEISQKNIPSQFNGDDNCNNSHSQFNFSQSIEKRERQHQNQQQLSESDDQKLIYSQGSLLSQEAV